MNMKDVFKRTQKPGKLITLLIALLFITSSGVFSQTLKGAQASEKVTQAKEVYLEKDNTISHIKYEASKAPALSDKSFLRRSLSLSAENSFVEINRTTDKLGMQHIRLQQYYQGIPIEGKVYIIHSKNEKILSANGSYQQDVAMEIAPQISKSKAYKIALLYFNAQQYNSDINNPEGELVILPHNGSEILAYKFDLYSSVPLKREFVYVNAITGELAQAITRIHHQDRIGTAETMYSGTQEITTDSVSGYFRLRENGRGNGIITYNANNKPSTDYITDFVDDDNYWNDTTNFDAAAYECHFATEKTYDFFLEKFGRDSYDGNGAQLISYVHIGENYANAYWNGEAMHYGDGDGERYDPLTSVEVTAHEITHGLTEYTAGLIYQNESGALNESFSDIMGVSVDNYCNPGPVNFEIGNDFSLIGNGFRNMAYPNSKNDPDTYKGRYWVTGNLDNGGVHSNSGVQNYWFYLLVEGGIGVNDLGNAYKVKAIGIEKAVQIAYRNLAVYLIPNSNYANARRYSIQAATDLYGECSQEVISVTNAWYAVGVGELPNVTAASFVTSSNYSCTAPGAFLFTDKSRNATLWHWNFGDGASSTLQNPNHVYTDSGNYAVTLTIQGNGECQTHDTLGVENAIMVKNHGAPTVPLCNPETEKPGTFGIYKVIFEDIMQLSQGSMEGNPDFSCSRLAELIAGESYGLIIHTNPDIPENVKVWIDFNNDGEFDAESEEVLSSENVKENHTQNINITNAQVYDTPLRMRIASDIYFKEITPCQSLYKGQYEDYSIIIRENANAPIAQIAISNRYAKTGLPITFTDESENNVLSRKWIFENGAPAASTEKQVQVTYDTPGNYGVTLMVENEYGADTLLYTDTICVIDEYRVSKTIYTNEPNGTLWGPEGKNVEINGCMGFFFIDVPGADSIIVEFKNTFINDGRIMCCDDINVDTFWTFYFDCKTVEQSDFATAKFVSTTGGVVLKVLSMIDTIGNANIEVTWRSVMSEELKANFEVSNMNPAINTKVGFRDASYSGIENYFWEFSDGTNYMGKYVNHAFSKPGRVKITQYVSNHFGMDTVSKTIEVQEAPILGNLPDTIELVMQTEMVKIINLELINNAPAGDLEISLQTEEQIEDDPNRYWNINIPEGLKGVNVLALTRFYEDIYNAIDDLEPNFHTTLIDNSSYFDAPYVTAEILDTIDILDLGFYYGRRLIDLDYVKTWIYNGGGLLLNHPSPGEFNFFNDWLSEFGISYYFPGSPMETSKSIAPHQLTRDIDAYSLSPSGLSMTGTSASLSTWGNALPIVSSSSASAHIACASYGKGKIIVSGDIDLERSFDATGHTQFLRNAMLWLANRTNWVNCNIETQVVKANNTFNAELNFSSVNLPVGTYYAKIKVLNNDSTQTDLSIPIKLIVDNETNVPIMENLSLNIFPNPVQNKLSINCPQFIEAIIYSTTGSLLFTSNTPEINTEALPSGIYIVKVKSGQGNYQTKFIKQ